MFTNSVQLEVIEQYDVISYCSYLVSNVMTRFNVGTHLN